MRGTLGFVLTTLILLSLIVGCAAPAASPTAAPAAPKPAATTAAAPAATSAAPAAPATTAAPAAAATTAAPKPAATTAAAGAAPAIVLTAVYWSEGWEFSREMFKLWVERVNQKAAGKLRIDIKGGPEIIPIAEQVKATGEGVIDIAENYATGHAAQVPEVQTSLASELSAVEERQVGYYDLLDKAHEKIGVKYIGRTAGNNGFYVFSKKPITKIADFKGLKIRGHAGYKPFFDWLGATTVQMAVGEVYTALERGLVEATAAVIFNYDSGWGRVAPNILDEPFWPANNCFTFMNLKKWNSLPKDMQDLLMNEQIQLEKELPNLAVEYEAKEKKRFTDTGTVKFTKLADPKEEKDYFRQAIVAAFRFGGQQVLSNEREDQIKKMIWKQQ